MKTRCSKPVRFASVLIAGLCLMLAEPATAQTFTTLHNFTETGHSWPYTNSDGAYPYASLLLSSNTLYGTTYYGGSSGVGTLFKVNTDGRDFTTLHNFAGGDGASPIAGLILSGNSLCGTTAGSSYGGGGTVFMVNTDGTGFSTLHDFYAGLAVYPYAGLTLAGTTLFGTTHGLPGERYDPDYGTVFKVNTDGTAFTFLHFFAQTSASYPYTNGDGAHPFGGLVLASNILYGTTYYGGISGGGTVFKVNTDGTGFTTLHVFTGVPSAGPYTNSDGANPVGGLVLASNILYGTTFYGGSAGGGIVFKVNTDGTGFGVLHNFGGTDGANLIAGLMLRGDTLYGTAADGGSSGNGTVFAINLSGTNFTILHSFAAATGYNYFGHPINSDGANPHAALVLSGNTLYGTTHSGGSSGDGTVFSLSFPPQLTITCSDTNVILTWPTSYAGFSYTGFALQSATNLVPPTVWSTVSPSPVVVNGQNTVTNPISGSQQFFRLVQ